MRVLQRLHIIYSMIKNPLAMMLYKLRDCLMGSLAMTYFSHRDYTIIGAGLFHCPVRDGKEWDQNRYGRQT